VQSASRLMKKSASLQRRISCASRRCSLERQLACSGAGTRKNSTYGGALQEFFISLLGEEIQVATYVLVHGSFWGSWCWSQVARLLRAAGHDTYAPSLTGIGERVHLASPETTLDTHIQDVCGSISVTGSMDGSGQPAALAWRTATNARARSASSGRLSNSARLPDQYRHDIIAI
jgi:hypothetical protein